MEALDLARWQFAITTVYHFILVPLTIGLSPLVAIMQTKWLRSGDARWLKLSEFFGKLLLINFALGVATGIVQEFQFGMNWSEYSRMVGDIFGAPLAFEALLAFFLESTFLGVWIFGRGRISPKMHTAAIWLFALGTNISALFILAANSFMQNPVGAVFNPTTGRAELDGATGFLQVIFSTTTMYTFAHTIAASLLVAGSFIAGISLWWLVRTSKQADNTEAVEYWKPAANFGLVTMLIASLLVITTGHFMGQHIYKEQPTKMIAAMGIAKTQEAAPLALLMLGTELKEEAIVSLPIPGLESFMVTHSFSGKDSKVIGAEEINKKFQTYFADVYGPNKNYLPDPFISFYSFRIMVMLGFASLALSILGLALIRRKELPDAKWIGSLFVWTIPLPYIASTFGWILTEMGRQPWVVYPNFQAQPMATTAPTDLIALLTQDGVSPSVHGVEIIISLVIFTLLYAILGVIWFILTKRYAVEGINLTKPVITEVRKEITVDTKLSFAY